MADHITIQTTGFSFSKRLVRNDQIVAILLKLTSGRWGIYDTTEKALTTQTFQTPAKARDAFVKLEQKTPT